MSTAELYDVLNRSPSLPGHENLLKEYLVSQVERHNAGRDDPQKIAYEMAGLLSARAFERTPHENPFVQILWMAATLELPEAHHTPGASWTELKRLVAELP